MFINFKLKFYRILVYIASLPCYLFVLFLYLWWSCIYTGADDVTGDWAPPQWEAGWWNYFSWNLNICFKFYVDIKVLWREICFVIFLRKSGGHICIMFIFSF